MTEKVLYLLGGAAFLIAAVFFALDHEPLWAAGAAFAALLVFAFAKLAPSRSPQNEAQVQGANPSPEAVRAYREQHPGVGITEAVQALKSQG